MAAILGKKIGMTQIFDEAGRRVSITAIEAGPCALLRVNEKTVQLAFDAVKDKKIKKPVLGRFKKAAVAPCRFIREIARELSREYKIGQQLKASEFKAGDYVDITGVSIGKGFAGGMKRWNWHGGGGSHGSTSHRRIGSTGSSSDPSRVWKGHHQAGHMGADRVTVQNLKVIRADEEKNLILVQGGVPGHKNGYLIIKSAKKKKVNPRPDL